MYSDEMKELAGLVKNVPTFIDLTIGDVKNIVRKEKQHLASTFECSSVNVLVRPTFRYAHLTYTYFTPQTRTRQDCLVLSCPCLRCEMNSEQVKTVGDRKFRN